VASLEDEGDLGDEERGFLGAEQVTSAMVIPLANPGVNPGELRVDGLVYAGRRDGSLFEPNIVAQATQVAGRMALNSATLPSRAWRNVLERLDGVDGPARLRRDRGGSPRRSVRSQADDWRPMHGRCPAMNSRFDWRATPLSVPC
jgi:hypothetical protein